MEILLVLGVIVAGVVIWGNARAAKRASTESTTAPASGGKLVGGWLAFLILVLIILAPIANALKIALDLRVGEFVNDGLKDMDTWSSFKVAAWVNYLAVTAIGMIAGLRLLLKRTWGVVRLAVVALWLTGPLGTLMYGYVLPKTYLGQPAPGFDKPLFVAVLAATIWTLYLFKSERVKATYVENPQSGLPFTNSPT